MGPPQVPRSGPVSLPGAGIQQQGGERAARDGLPEGVPGHMPDGFVKCCSHCEHVWRGYVEFIGDESLAVNGYQACFENPERGYVLCTHQVPGCGTTIAVPVVELRPLYDGPQYTRRQTGLERCRRFCLERGPLEECDVECDMAWARRVLQYLRRHALPEHLK